MGKQSTPEVTQEDVERIVRRDFAPTEVAAAMALLERYGGESWHREIERVRLAVLKLANGDLQRLAVQVDEAGKDYRDILGPAEFPGYMEHHDAALDDAEKQRIIDADWHQYQQWLKT